MKILWAGIFFVSSFAVARPEWRDLGYNQNLPRLKCDLTVDFSSNGSGIDNIEYDATKNFLSTNDAIKTVTSSGHGKEGEKALCIEVVDKTSLDQTYEALSAAINKPKRIKVGGIRITKVGNAKER